jgi:hypothetical protein
MSSVYIQRIRLIISDEITSMEAVAHIVALPFLYILYRQIGIRKSDFGGTPPIRTRSKLPIFC